jgi:TPP-dependent trihydroxycyclohexane-1,2-dione (THcHDO) dehydratase
MRLVAGRNRTHGRTMEPNRHASFQVEVETFAGRGSCTDDDWFCLGGVGVTGNPLANAIARDDPRFGIDTQTRQYAAKQQPKSNRIH